MLLKVRFLSKKLYRTRFLCLCAILFKGEVADKIFCSKGELAFSSQTIYFKKDREVGVLHIFLSYF
jgi:hypothetical protein